MWRAVNNITSGLFALYLRVKLCVCIVYSLLLGCAWLIVHSAANFLHTCV